MVEVPSMSPGDIAALVSPVVTLYEPGCLSYAYNLSPDERLEVGYRSTPASFVTHPLCLSYGDLKQRQNW